MLRATAACSAVTFALKERNTKAQGERRSRAALGTEPHVVFPEL